MNRFKLAILKNETGDNHLPWIQSCEKFKEVIDFKIIDLTSSKWLDEVLSDKYDFFLTRSTDRQSYFKQLYDERVYILNQVLHLNIYPKLNELLIYENKKLLSYFLKANDIPSPKTWIFYNKEEALDFIKHAELPIVAKTSIGSSGSGVKIINSKENAEKYICDAFSNKGITRSFIPNIRKGDYLNRIKKRFKNINDSIEYFREKKKAATQEPQKWFVLFQEYIETEYEWRCVVIDDSYFGHKKLRSYGEKFSGTSKVSWDYPDEQLLNLLRNIIEKTGFWSQAIDLFYDKKRGYFVNEMQCFWGSKNPHQMIKDDKPGRFVSSNGNWIFQEGEFNTNNSYNLRLQHILKLLKEKNGK